MICNDCVIGKHFACSGANLLGRERERNASNFIAKSKLFISLIEYQNNSFFTGVVWKFVYSLVDSRLGLIVLITIKYNNLHPRPKESPTKERRIKIVFILFLNNIHNVILISLQY